MSDAILIVATLMLGIWIGSASSHKEAATLIAQCEAELPRNHHCILQAVPAPEDETR